MIYDAVIIGKGPAGISCAIYLKRYGYNPLVIGKDGGSLETASLIDNYYGIKHITGKELINIGIEQAEELGIDVKTEEVINVSFEGQYLIECSENTYTAKTLVLATGTSRNRYTKADKFEAVSYCAICDGFFYRKKKIGLIGNGKYMEHELNVLKNMCKDIIVFTDGQKLDVELDSNIPVVTSKITDILGDVRINAIVTEDGKYDIEGCFIAIGNASGFTFAKHLGIALDGNKIVVDDGFMTNLPGLFACGDCVGGLLQVSKAVGDGAICATSISKYLKSNNL